MEPGKVNAVISILELARDEATKVVTTRNASFGVAKGQP
jgi:hypothetical protein